MLRNPAELGRILEEKQDLEMQHKKIIEEHAQLRYRYVSYIIGVTVIYYYFGIYIGQGIY